MWGTGARDQGTIPSHLARLIAADADIQQPVEITNLGESGYVSTQEVILLMRRLQAGERPAVVLFYDGFNDVVSSYQHFEVGQPQNEDNRRDEFNLLNEERRGDLYRSAFRLFLRETALYRLLSPTTQEGEQEQRVASTVAARIPGLAKETVDLYRANVSLVQALAASYNFRPLFFWQPTLYSKERLSSTERTEAEARLSFRTLMLRVIDRLPPTSPDPIPQFINLTDLFKADPRSVYLDAVHMTEEGNARVAQEMAPALKAALRARSGEADPLQGMKHQ
jgi:lysophospholipase L1-like esterase